MGSVTKAKAERGHPIFFIAAIVIVAFALLSIGKALASNPSCGGSQYGGKKHWVVMPPQWQCGDGGVKLTKDS
jgi:hypothetical protein